MKRLSTKLVVLFTLLMALTMVAGGTASAHTLTSSHQTISTARTSASASARTAFTRGAQEVRVSVTSHVTMLPGVSSASTTCWTRSATEETTNLIGIELIGFTLESGWCANSTIILTWNVSSSWVVTSWGSQQGYSFDRFYGYFSNCYDATGSTILCSGVTQNEKAEFDHGSGSCTIDINEDINYKGGFFPTASNGC